MKTLKDFENRMKQLWDEFEEFKKKHGKMSAPEIGDVIEIEGNKWTVLDQGENGFFCIGDLIKNSEFGETNNWKDSGIRRFLNGEYLKKLENEIGVELVEFERNLLSLDGQREYGTVKDFVSLITFDEYRKYRKLLPNTGKWWWTLTPHSTTCNEDGRFVTVVSPSGRIINDDCGNFSGVRPVCIFPSSLFES